VASTIDRWGWPVPWLDDWPVGCVVGGVVICVFVWLVEHVGITVCFGFDVAQTSTSAGGFVAIDAAVGVPAMGVTTQS
jgi:hypothetical protein